MTNNRPKPGNPNRSGLRPGQDFYGVGMSLPTYRSRGNPNAARQRRSGQLVGGESLQKHKGRNYKTIFKRTGLVMVILTVLIGGWLGGKFLYNAYKLSNGNLLSVLGSTKLKGEDVGRVNILLAGNSADDIGHAGGELTDSIMLLSINTKSNQAYMMSIPRDLYVEVDGDYAKINTAYVTGNANDYSKSGFPDGGMGQLQEVVEDNFDVNINYYALINYNAFKQAVDAVGGITITVDSDDPRGLYDPNIDYTTGGPLVRLANGKQKLNGQQALNLARARGDAFNSYGFAGSDFDRSSNQRQMLLALKDKAVSAGTLTNPAKISSLADAIGNNVDTDMSLGEVRRLYDLTKGIGGSNIVSISLNNVLGQNLLESYRANDGSSALIPAAGIDDYSEIQSAIRRATSASAVVRENARIVVLNATDTSGLASRVRDALNERDYNVVAVGDADTMQAQTTVIDASGGKKSGTRKALSDRYGGRITTTNLYDGIYDADFIILVGDDQIPKTTNQ